MIPFETKLRGFIRTCPDCKILDDGSKNPKGGVADFLLNNDKVVAELKCLEENMLAKLQEFATELINSRNLNMFGQVPFDKIIEMQADQSRLKKAAIKKIGGDRLQTDFRDANRQIRNTKNRFGLPGSYGLLIVANTGNNPLQPDLAYWFLSLLLRKRKENGSPLCSAIDCILYLSEIHNLGRLDGVALKPAIIIPRDERPEYEALNDYLGNGFLRDWANFNNIPFFEAEKRYNEIQNFSQTPMRRLVPLKEKPRPPYINARFPIPALCKECGATFAHPADVQSKGMYVNEPQKDLYVVGFVCPQCDQIADTRVADLAVDKDGDIINVYPWTGTLDDMLKPSWRNFIDRESL